MKKVLGIIPARLSSTRLPGKMLADICGEPLICHTIRQAKKSKLLDDLVLATDSKEIKEALSILCEFNDNIYIFCIIG